VVLPTSGEIPQIRVLIGWIGSPSTSWHINVAAQALNQLCQNNDVQFIAIGALEQDVAEIKGQLIPCREETEVQELNSFNSLRFIDLLVNKSIFY
jgi:hypothetical protein